MLALEFLALNRYLPRRLSAVGQRQRLLHHPDFSGVIVNYECDHRGALEMTLLSECMVKYAPKFA